ncbi:arsenic resistance N-acetyltransferase ArsN2 [Pseudoduganella sp. UC29_106]|uniref:arsenic resistance N-acetyltransferase ArsN2 n=1 Tax=Pseudoduganella sp. UC29_106 TaxID=3374553 RepID=UPI003756FB30
MNSTTTLRDATAADWPAIEALLVAANLPLDGARDHLGSFMIGEGDGQVRCVAGFEQYEGAALLRSVAVAGALRGQGLGDQLLGAIKAKARARGVDTLYLLTTTAAPFFAQRGFVPIERNATPAALQASREFQGVCPASASAMAASLTV